MKPYPVDLRERLLQAEDAGLVRAEIARCFGISPRSLSRWRRLHREQGSPAPRPPSGPRPALPPERWSALRAQVAAHPDATLAEHCARWAAEQGARVSEATMSRLLARVGAATQKQTLIARERDEAERAAFRAGAAALAPADLVFLDETDTPTTLTPLRGPRPARGAAMGRVPRGRRKQVALVTALTPDGVAAPVMLPGALDCPAFEAWVAQELVPALRSEQTVLLDNLNVHKSARAGRLVEAAGCRLCFPRYSPDFNPIEPAFAKLKQQLRRAEACTFEALVDAAGPALAALTPADARGFYRAAGYLLPGQLL